MFQKELQAALPVPVASSSLLQVSLAQAVLPAGKRVGILTFSAEQLTPRHLSAAGVPLDTPIDGLRKGDHFQQVYGDHGAEPDLPKMERELIAAAERMLERHPDVGAFVLECTNMPPHAAALRRATGLPVHDIVGFIEWFGRSLRPPAYPEN
jgi:Asp/Glu/hydantoin racemase